MVHPICSVVVFSVFFICWVGKTIVFIRKCDHFIYGFIYTLFIFLYISIYRKIYTFSLLCHVSRVCQY